MKAHAWARAALILTLASASPAAGQTVRISGATSMQYIELRPFVRDTVPAGDAPGTGLLRQLPDGRVVRCIPGEPFCSRVRPGGVVSTVPMIHDVDVSVWGFGRGLRVLSQLRGRTSFGGRDDLWPREDRHFEVLSLYGEMERGDFRVRAGRQWRMSGLGFYNFDGVAVTFRPGPTASLEAYGGRSLSRGLNEGRTAGALESIESLSIPNAGILFGLQGRYRPSPRLTMGAVYQVDFRGDRTGAYSELVSTDGTVRIANGSAEVSVEYDLAGQALNHARLTLRSPPVGQNTTFFARARRYRPYFELWTIWGAFSPVGFDEGVGGVTWARRDGRLVLRGEASYRSYDDPGTEDIDPYRTTGWGVETGVNWSPLESWHFDGSYRLESGLGASRWDGQFGARRDLGEGNLGLRALAFQQLYEFRIGEGTVLGIGVDGSFPLGERVRVFASASAYHQNRSDRAGIDWNQRRASLRLEWMLGSEPGIRPGETPP